MNVQITARKSAAFVLATMFVTLGYGAVSAAADVGTVPQVSVSYADLNLSSEQGAATLYNRIQAAASSVCEKSYPYDDGLHSRILVRQCAHRSLRNAVQKIREPLLTAVYNSNNSDFIPGRAVVAQAH